MKETLRFLQDLSLHNDKEWFDANKDKTHMGLYINRAIDFVREEKKEYFSSLDF